MIAQHSSETNEHYTPADIVERARYTLGEIDLDPASCEIAQTVVKAGEYWNVDGLDPTWRTAPEAGFKPARVFLNPPGGKLDRVTMRPIKAGPGLSSAAVWWAKLWYEWNIGNVHSAVFVCFSMAIFRTAQEFSPEVPPPFAFPFCVPEERINYDRYDAVAGRVPTKGAPADSALILIPPKSEYVPASHSGAEETWYGDTLSSFSQAFSPLGVVRI